MDECKKHEPAMVEWFESDANECPVCKEIERLRKDLLRIDNYCRANDIDIEQALKGEQER